MAEDILIKVIVPFVAAVIGALSTFFYQKGMQKRTDKKYILASLMANRHVGTTDADFVKALNMVDIIFHDNKKVKELLHKYFAYTGSTIYSGGLRVDTFYQLILEMARDIGYKDLKHSDINDFYVPEPPNNPTQSGNSEPLKS